MQTNTKIIQNSELLEKVGTFKRPSFFICLDYTEVNCELHKKIYKHQWKLTSVSTYRNSERGKKTQAFGQTPTFRLCEGCPF